MPERISKLQKLRGRSIAELRVRARQEVSKLQERLLGLRTSEMSDSALCRALRCDRKAEPSGCVERVIARLRDFQESVSYSGGQTFFESLRNRDDIIGTIENRFPEARGNIVDGALQVARGRINLLAGGEFDLGETIDWHLEPVSRKRTDLSHWSTINYLDPSVAGDKKITWEINRHNHFITLGQAYYLTGDRRFAAAFVSQASSWMDANPPNRGINWASSLEVAFRSIAWLWSLHLLAGARELTPWFMKRLLKHLYEHGRHVERYLSCYFSPNTHLTGEALGLFYLGVAMPEFKRARRWRETGLSVMIEQLPRQVRPDGVHFEQATYYHRYTVDFYLHLILLARAIGIEPPQHVMSTCELMLEYLMWITRPDGSSPLIGDDDGGRLVMLGQRPAHDFRDTLAIGAAVFNRGDWKHVAGEAPVEILWLLGPKGLKEYDRLAEERPAQHSRAFAHSGHFIMRDGWSSDSSYAAIACGPHGALAGGHAHAGALALEFAAIEKPWLIDAGTYTYTGEPETRDQFRVTRAHNTVTVDDEPQSEPGGPFAWSRVARGIPGDFIAGKSIDYFIGSHDGYQRLSSPVTHTRSVLMVKSRPDVDGSDDLRSYLVVRDTFETSGRHTYDISYHLSPGCLAGVNGRHVLAVDPEGQRLNLSVFGRTAPSARIVDSWISRGYLHREQTSSVVFEFQAEGPAEFVTFIIPSRKGRAVRIEERLLGPSPAYGFYVTEDDVHDVLLLGDGETVSRCGPLAASAVVAWCRFVDGRITRAVLVGGRQLETNHRATITSRETRGIWWTERESDGAELLLGGFRRAGEDRGRAGITVAESFLDFGIGLHGAGGAVSEERAGKGW